MQLYLIRHAQSMNNATMLLNEKEREFDPPLTPIGFEQADRLAQHIRDGYNPDGVFDRMMAGDPDARSVRGFSFTRLYCSPMYRSLLTTRPIAEVTGLQPEIWVGIHEHGGLYLDYEDERGIVSYPGRTRAEIAEEFPGYTLTDDLTDTGWWHGQREDTAAAFGRAIQVASQLHQQAEESPDERIALVSHGTFLSALMKALTNTLPNRRHWYHHHNSAMTRVDFGRDGRLEIRFQNRVDHLTADLIT